MFSLRSQIVGCNHDPVSLGRSGRAGLFEPVSRHRSGMGAGAWDALARGRVGSALRLAVANGAQWRVAAPRLAPQQTKVGILGKTRCL